MLDASQIERQVSSLSGILPAQTQQLLTDQLHQLVEASGGTLGIGAVVEIVLALWSASRGMSGLITSLNIAYEEKERRGFFKLRHRIALGLTLGLMVGGVVVIALVAVLPAVVQFLDLGAVTKWLLLVVEWPLLIVLVMLGLAVLYRYAPIGTSRSGDGSPRAPLRRQSCGSFASIAFTVARLQAPVWPVRKGVRRRAFMLAGASS